MFERAASIVGMTLAGSMFDGSQAPRLSDLGSAGSPSSSQAALGLVQLLVETMLRLVPDPTLRATDGLPLLSGDIELIPTSGDSRRGVAAYRILFAVHPEVKGQAHLGALLESILKEHRAARHASNKRRKGDSRSRLHIDSRDRLRRVVGLHFGEMISASSVDQYALDDARSPIAFAKVFGIERWVANPLKGACMLEAKYVSVGSYARGSADSHGPRLTFLVPPCPQHVWEIRSSELSVDSLCQLRLPSFDCTVESARDAWDLQLQSYLRNHRPLPSTVSSNQQGVTAAAETLRFDPEAAFLELNGFSKDADSAATAPSPSLAEMGRHNRAQLLAVERSCLLAAEPDQNADDAAARHHRFCEARETWQHSAFERFRSRVWTGHSVYLSDAQRAIVSHGGATLTSRRLAKSTNNFSLLADWLLRFSISIEEGFGVVADGTLNVVLTFLAALNASDPEPKNKLHALMCGDHAQSKSFTLHVLQSLLIPGVAKSMTYMTNASMAFEGNSNGTVYIFEECPHKMLGVSARGRPSSMNEVETRAKQQLTSGQVTVMELGYSQGKRVSRVSTHTCNTVFVCATNAPFQKMAPAMQSRFLQIHTSGGKNADVIAKICESQTAAQRELKDEVIEISRWLQYHVQLVFLLVDVGILVVDLSLTNATLPRIFAAAARRGLPHAQSVREVERVRCLVRLLVVIRAVMRNLTTTNGVSA